MKTFRLRAFAGAAALAFSILAGAADSSPSRKEVLKLAAHVADWQLAHLGESRGISKNVEESINPRSWQQGAFWVGMTRLADVSGEKRFVDAILAQGRS